MCRDGLYLTRYFLLCLVSRSRRVNKKVSGARGGRLSVRPHLRDELALLPFWRTAARRAIMALVSAPSKDVPCLMHQSSAISDSGFSASRVSCRGGLEGASERARALAPLGREGKIHGLAQRQERT